MSKFYIFSIFIFVALLTEKMVLAKQILLQLEEAAKLPQSNFLSSANQIFLSHRCRNLLCWLMWVLESTHRHQESAFGEYVYV